MKNRPITRPATEGMASVADLVIGRFFTPAYAARRTAHYSTVRSTLLSIDPRGYAGCCAAIVGMTIADGLPGITTPTLVISGTHDPATPAERGREITDADTGRPVQTEQDLQPVRIGQQVESLGPPDGVHVGQRRRRAIRRRLVC